MRRSPLPACAGLVMVFALSGCGAAAAAIAPAPDVTRTHNSSVSASFLKDPKGKAITYDETLVKAGARVGVQTLSTGGSTTVKLAVRDLQPHRAYGAHAHTKPCGPTGDAAGPHFQNVVDPVQPSVDPKFANPENEIWLDFTTDDMGAASVETTVPWEFSDDRRAHSVIIHAMRTATEAGKAGTAGARAACINVDF